MANNAVKESMITEYVDDHRELTSSFDTMHFKEKVTFPTDSTGISEVILMNDSILDKYRNDLKELEDEMTFDREEVGRYYGNPWALSYDLYGTVEYWHLLLDLNGMYSATEFTSSTVKVYDESLPTLVDHILSLEEDFIDANQAEIDDYVDTSNDDVS